MHLFSLHSVKTRPWIVSYVLIKRRETLMQATQREILLDFNKQCP